MQNLHSHPVFKGGKIPNPTIIVSINSATSQHWRSFGQGGCSVGTLRPAPRRVHTRPNSHGVSHAAAIVYPKRESPGMIVSEGVAFVKRLILIWIFFLSVCPRSGTPFCTYFNHLLLSTHAGYSPHVALLACHSQLHYTFQFTNYNRLVFLLSLILQGFINCT